MAFTINGTSGINLATQPLTGVLPDANAPSGSVIQVVQATTTTAITSTSSSLVDVLSASITPSSSSNKILVYASFAYQVEDNNDGYHEAAGTSYLLRGATTLNYNTYQTYVGGESRSQALRGYGGYIFMDSPSTTSSTTYKLQISANDSNYYIQMPYSGTTCSLILMEIAT